MGESLTVLAFFSTHIDLVSCRPLMMTTTITPVEETKSFFGGSSAQSI